MKKSQLILPADCFLLAGIPKKEQEALAALAPPPCTFRKGECLFPLQGGRALGILLAGCARVFRTGTDGETQVCNHLAAGDAFGVAALFSETPAVSTVVAEQDGTVWFIPEETLLLWMRQQPLVGENLVRFLTERIRFLNRSLNELRGGTAAQRLLAHLRTLADTNGNLTLPSLSALAARLDMGRTSLYRALDELEAAGALTRNGKTVTLIQSL